MALNVRVAGLALGGQVVLSQGSATVTAVLNGPYSFTPQVAAGAPLGLRVSSQPVGQTCAVSELAPAMVRADGSPVFVRCVSQPAARLTVPDTLPNGALTLRFPLQDKAYPGIPYESRPGVVGGIFPYEYRLLSFTRDGVTQDASTLKLDFRAGTVRFTPSVEGNYALTLEVRDSGAVQKTLQQTFNIKVAASSFAFVAPDGLDAAGRGSRGAPFKTIAYAQANSGPDKVLLLRKGSYSAVGLALADDKAKQVVAYPDEVVTLDLARSSSIDIRSDRLPMPRVEGVDITGVIQYGINVDPALAGAVIRNVRFVDGQEGPVKFENPAFIHTWGDVLPRHKLLVQDNDFGRYVGAGYATTLYDVFDSIIENNQLRLGEGVNGGFHDKDNAQFNVYRQNYIEAPANSSNHAIQISAQYGSKGVHIHHNLLINGGVLLGTQCLTEGCTMTEHNVHHNTVVGAGISQSWGVFNAGSSGTRITHNIISSGKVAPYWGVSCQRLPDSFATAMVTGANLIETSSATIHKDTECSGNDMTWPVWQSFGRDTAASGSALTSTSALVGTGPLTGLPAGDARRGQRGHQLP